MVVARLRTITESEFLLEMVHTDDIDFCLNYIIFLGKFSIYKKIFGTGNLDPYTAGFLAVCLAVERLACMREGKLQRKFAKWNLFYNEL